MQYPVALALIYFHRRSAQGDREVVDTLRSELGIAEDVTKDAGLVIGMDCCSFSASVIASVSASVRFSELMPLMLLHVTAVSALHY